MPPKKPDQDTSTDQLRRFQEAAKELDCDPDEERFRDTLRRVATVKLPSDKPK